MKNASKEKPAKSSGTSFLGDLGFVLLKVLILGMGIIVVLTYIFGLTVILDDSMHPAVASGDLALYYRLDRSYVAQETVVLKYEGETQLRRVVAVEGDVVDITEFGLTINGYLQQEENIYEDTLPYEDGVTFPITVGPGQVFVLGDKRTGVVDSRVYGCVDIHDTLGKTFAIIRRRNI